MTACSFGGSARKHFNQGVANYNSGDYEQAIADYSKAIEFDPNYALAYYNRGHA
jgi:tetratricopeptide (TPR) repeat protein